MKPLTCVPAIVLGLVALTTAPVMADGERSVTAAATCLFPVGAELGAVALEGIQIGTGVFIEADGSASGTRHAVLQGTALGFSREITASLDLGDGAPPLPSIAFSVTAGTDVWYW